MSRPWGVGQCPLFSARNYMICPLCVFDSWTNAHIMCRMMSQKSDQANTQGAPGPVLSSVLTGSSLSSPQLPCPSSGLTSGADKSVLVIGIFGSAVHSTYHEELGGPTSVLALYRTFERWWDRQSRPNDSSALMDMPFSFVLLWHAEKKEMFGKLHVWFKLLRDWNIMWACSVISLYSTLACCKMACTLCISLWVKPSQHCAKSLQKE